MAADQQTVIKSVITIVVEVVQSKCVIGYYNGQAFGSVT